MKPVPLQPAKILGLLLVIALLLSACGSDLWGTYDPYLTSLPEITGTGLEISEATPSATRALPTQPFATLTFLPTLTGSPLPLFLTLLTPTGTATPVALTVPPGSTISYVSQSGDSLDVVAIHFGVSPSEITSPGPLPSTGFINPGTLLFMPNRLSQTPTTPSQPIIPDSELVDSPSAVGFDITGYVNSAGGYLSTFTDFHPPVGHTFPGRRPSDDLRGKFDQPTPDAGADPVLHRLGAGTTRSRAWMKKTCLATHIHLTTRPPQRFTSRCARPSRTS